MEDIICTSTSADELVHLLTLEKGVVDMYSRTSVLQQYQGLAQAR